MGVGYHVLGHPHGLAVLDGDHRFVLAYGGRLGVEQSVEPRDGDCGAEAGDPSSTARKRFYFPFGSWRSVCVHGL